MSRAPLAAGQRPWRAGVLGATGIVGQRLVHLLAQHPWFELAEVAASERSSGKRYADAVRWHLPEAIPDAARNLVVKDAAPPLACDFVFSGLDSSVAGPIEAAFARAGYPVVSNSKNYRMEPDVPLLIPEVNAAHLTCIPMQKKNRGFESGFLVTNPNCSTAGLGSGTGPPRLGRMRSGSAFFSRLSDRQTLPAPDRSLSPRPRESGLAASLSVRS